jgi:prepilin peptidase CpaA
MKAAAIQWIFQLATARLDDVRAALLVVLLLLAAAIDVRQMRVPNWLTLSGAAAGVLLSAGTPWIETGMRWALDGALSSLGGMGVGLLLLLPLYVLGVMGAGDVKLMAMVGSFVGLQQIVQTVLCVFVVGGLFAAMWILCRRVFRRAAANVALIVMAMAAGAASGTGRVSAPFTSVGKLPYGVAIALGTLVWLLLADLAVR